MRLNQIRRGNGLPLLLLHGLGGSWGSWRRVLPLLEKKRNVIAVDLPGFGKTPALQGPVSIESLADGLIEFLVQNDLIGVDVAGSSMGARLALELARRGAVGATVALNPAGFWQGWEKAYFLRSLQVSVNLLRFLEPALPYLLRTRVGRTILLAQLSARPWAVPEGLAIAEMVGCANSPSFDELLRSLVEGPPQLGIPINRPCNPIAIGWGRQDRVCFPWQAMRALDKFPSARLEWFEGCGHYPHWDVPRQAANFILDNTALDIEFAKVCVGRESDGLSARFARH